MIADHRRNLGRVGKIETLPIFPICRRPSQTVGDVRDFEFSLVGKIWVCRETVKSPIVLACEQAPGLEERSKFIGRRECRQRGAKPLPRRFAPRCRRFAPTNKFAALL